VVDTEGNKVDLSEFTATASSDDEEFFETADATDLLEQANGDHDDHAGHNH
jgi:hypothetical protein